MISDMAAYGAAGLVSVAANVWPRIAHEYVKKCLNNELSSLSFQRVRLESRRKPVQMTGNDMKSSTIWQQACKALFIASNPIPTKAVLHYIGLIEHKTVRLPLSTEDFPSVDEIKKAIEIILNLEKVANPRKVFLRHTAIYSRYRFR